MTGLPILACQSGITTWKLSCWTYLEETGRNVGLVTSAPQ
jgi:hypothetical protein